MVLHELTRSEFSQSISNRISLFLSGRKAKKIKAAPSTSSFIEQRRVEQTDRQWGIINYEGRTRTWELKAEPPPTPSWWTYSVQWCWTHYVLYFQVQRGTNYTSSEAAKLFISSDRDDMVNGTTKDILNVLNVYRWIIDTVNFTRRKYTVRPHRVPGRRERKMSCNNSTTTLFICKGGSLYLRK